MTNHLRGSVQELTSERDATEPRRSAQRGARYPEMLASAFEREAVRYLVVAGATTMVYLGVLALLLATGLPYMLAILAAQAVIISGAFPAYRRLIFRSSGPWKSDLMRFVGVWGGGFVAGVVATPALVELVGVPPLPAQAIAVVVVAGASYLGHRFVSFRR